VGTIPAAPGGTTEAATSQQASKQDAVKGRIGGGVVWSLANSMALRFGSVVAGVVMARLLSPGDYGVFAIALTVTNLLLAFNELGVSLALVQWEGDIRRFAPTAMTVSIVSSAICYLGVYLVAPAYCDMVHSPHAVAAVRLLCVGVILDGIAQVPSGILNREFMQARRFASDMAAFAGSTSVTIVLAAQGAGPMSYVVGQIVGNCISVTCYLVLTPVKVWPGWSRTQARKLVRFGLPLAGSSLLALSVTNVDNIIVGANTNVVALGLYLMAFNQSSWPLNVFLEAARRITLAGFARLTDDIAALQVALARGVGLLMAAVMPVCTMLILYARPMLSVVYGGKWVPAASALQILAVLGLLRVLLFVGYDLLVAFGASRKLLALQALWLTALVPALIVGTGTDGIRGAAIGHVAVAGLVVVPAFLIVLRRYGFRLVASFAECVRPVIGVVLICAVTGVVFGVVVHPVARLVLGGLAALAVYAPVVLPMRSLLPRRASAQVAVEALS
jgi:PST family polysaccharide transporter